MADFKPFAAKIKRQFDLMSEGELFRVAIDGDALWAAYLAAFPEGSNPVYRVRTEHDGSYDRNFIRKLGNVVAVNELGGLYSIWSAYGDLDYPYNEVCQALDELVCNQAIVSVFRHNERKVGYVETTERLDSGQIKTWNHFHAEIKPAHFSASVAETLGEINGNVAVMKRGFEEISSEAVETVLSLIESNSLYRGAEFRNAVSDFAQAQRAYKQSSDRNTTLWAGHKNMAGRIRNTAIGSLLVDLSEGMDLERAVGAFEAKVAPTNYKRTTALITPRMVTEAMKTIGELGLEPALERRLARLSDVSINDVLWADNSAKATMKGSIGDVLMSAAVAKGDPAAAAEDISIDDFVANVLPKATGLSIVVRNHHQCNLMTLTAPVHDNIEPLFKWGNSFGWSYNGNITDSEMRKAVQAAGGRVDGAFRFTHSWNHEGRRNASLMDLHVFLPGHDGRRGQNHAGYGNSERVGWNNRKHLRSGGVQDVDFTRAAPIGYVPVENITFPKLSAMPEGVYRCAIQNWSKRDPTQGGFKAEIEFAGQVFSYDHPQPLKNHEWVEVAEVTLKNGEFTIVHKLPHGRTSQEVWGVQTETFLKVNMVLNSPNFWNGSAVGNKHWFFVIDGCRNDAPVRGIYNEFLKPELDKHRKVFEVLGDKTKCPVVDDQLSGLGFSVTKPDAVVLRATGPSINRTYNVRFG